MRRVWDNVIGGIAEGDKRKFGTAKNIIEEVHRVMQEAAV